MSAPVEPTADRVDRATPGQARARELAERYLRMVAADPGEGADVEDVLPSGEFDVYDWEAAVAAVMAELATATVTASWPPPSGEPFSDRDRAVDELTAVIKQAILDRCPVWEQQFDSGPGVVVSVSDAALIAAKTAVAVADSRNTRETAP